MSLDVLAGKALYIYDRLQEPSSHVAFGGIFAFISQMVPAPTLQLILQSISLLFFGLGVVFKEGTAETIVKISKQ